MNLTEKTVDDLTPPSSAQRFIFDQHRDAPKGFSIRLTRAGGKAFVLHYSFEGQMRRKTLGAWPTWSVIAARDFAKQLLQNIDRGIDPLTEKNERRKDPTISKVIEEFIEKHVSGLSSHKTVSSYLRQELGAKIGRLKPRDISRLVILELIEVKAEKAPIAARQLLIYAKQLFEFCVEREYLETNPNSGLKPKMVKVAGKKNPLVQIKRLRILDERELLQFWQTAARSGLSLQVVLCLKLILVTGQRPNECSGLHVDELDGDLWTIPASRRKKTDLEHKVPLSSLALEIIEDAKMEICRLSKRRETEWNGYLFENKAGKPLHPSSLAQAMGRKSRFFEANIHPEFGVWRPHDLRRTCRTGLSILGINTEISELVIGHAKQGMLSVYDLHQFEPQKKQALRAWSDHLTEKIG